MTTLDSRQQLERALASQCAADTLKPVDYLLWRDYRHTARTLVTRGRIFVVWKWDAEHSTPIVSTGLTVRSVSCSASEGLSITVETSKRESLHIGHSPARLGNLELFAHIPFMPEVSYVPRGSHGYALKLPVVLKMASNPDKPLAGNTYATPLAEFRAAYSGFSDLRL